ncbi:MAG: hypothetical protein NZ937_08295 [Armatimonadetes bacterium]|nr:hypothetical protein [Armatimonadota bacterium]
MCRFAFMLVLIALFLFGIANSQISRLRDLVAGKYPFVDRLHGFSVQLPPFWGVRVLGNAILIKDDELHFIIIRGVRYNGNIKQVAQKWLQEREAVNRLAAQLTGNIPRFAFKQTQHGIAIYGEGLGYPYTIDPQTSLNFSFLAAKGIQLPNDYREVTAILPGKSMAILVTLLFPSDTDEANRKQMIEIVKSFRFLSPNEMVSWRPEQVRCFETGLTAATMHVPEGFEFRAGVIRQDKKRRVAWFLRKGETMLRKDYIDLQTNIVQSPFGSNAMTILTINGQASQQPQPIVVSSKEDCIRLVMAIWHAETGKDWKLKESVEIPTPPLTKIFKERIRQEMAGFEQYMGSQSEDFNLAFIAESDGLVRNGRVSGSLLVANRPHPVAATQDCFLSIEVIVSQTPTGEFEKASSIFSGFGTSFTYNPEWIMTGMEIWSQEWRDELRFVRQMLQEHREFNTRMATAWTNLLSDQTYTKDPETGEIFRLHKRSWETGDFWREPVFGDVILGGVERGSKLEELLKTEGWRRLTESLEGFPEMWK